MGAIIPKEQIDKYCKENKIKILYFDRKRSDFQCKVCKYLFSTRPTLLLLHNSGCASCAKKNNGLKDLENNKIFFKHVKSKNLEILKLDCTLTKFKCLTCSHLFSTRPTIMLINESGCQKCSSAAYKIVQVKECAKQYKEICKEKKLKLLEPYIGAKHKILHKCLICKTEFNIKPLVVSSSKENFNGCTLCKNTKVGTRFAKSDKHHIDLVHKHKKVKVLKLIKENNQVINAECECLKCSYIFASNCSDLKQGSGCPVCSDINKIKNGTKRKYFIHDKYKFRVQGYEPQAISYLIKKININPSKILAGCTKKLPIIYYHINKKLHRYYPDIYVPTRNKLYEVKSAYTLGLSRKYIYYRVRAKALATIEAGYKYSILLMTEKGERLEMPKNWVTLTHKQFKKAFNEIHNTYY